MRSLFFTLSRFSISAWVGAAALFVVASVVEQTGPFPSEVKDHLALVRFPWYYAFGFSLVGFSLAASLMAAGHPAVPSARLWAFRGLTAAALAMMIADYFWIYRPLVEMLTASGVKPAEFVTYHEASKHINFADVSICFLAALIVCWPRTDRSSIGARE